VLAAQSAITSSSRYGALERDALQLERLVNIAHDEVALGGTCAPTIEHQVGLGR